MNKTMLSTLLCLALSTTKIRALQTTEDQPRRLLLAELAAVEGACSLAFTVSDIFKIGWLGTSQFCDNFADCCDDKRMFVPCSIACDYVKMLSGVQPSFDWSSTIEKLEGTVGRFGDAVQFPLNIREVTTFNKQFIPPFAEVGFAFRDICKFESLTSDTSKYDMGDYNKMIDRLDEYSITTNSLSNYAEDIELNQDEKEILFGICYDFAKANNKKIVSNKLSRTQIIKSDGTDFHFDRRGKGKHTIRLWIPLSDVENYPLVMGDARSYFESISSDSSCNWGDVSTSYCARKKRFKGVAWYQQKKMTPSDVIFWDMEKAPHGSVNVRPYQRTKNRVALVVGFDFVDVPSYYYS